MVKVLDGLVYPDSGQVRAFDQLVTERSLEDDQMIEMFRSRVGFIFQNSDAQVFPRRSAKRWHSVLSIWAWIPMRYPEVLLFDKPTAGLDPRSQRWLVELIVELVRSGKTIVIATHDVEMLRSVNLIHDHVHRHDGMWHVHDHEPDHHF